MGLCCITQHGVRVVWSYAVYVAWCECGMELCITQHGVRVE